LNSNFIINKLLRFSSDGKQLVFHGISKLRITATQRKHLRWNGKYSISIIDFYVF
jgi:hypothetical protein